MQAIFVTAHGKTCKRVWALGGDLAAPDCDQALGALMTAAHLHTGGHSHDDIALLLFELGASPPSSGNGQLSAIPGPAAP